MMINKALFLSYIICGHLSIVIHCFTASLALQRITMEGDLLESLFPMQFQSRICQRKALVQNFKDKRGQSVVGRFIDRRPSPYSLHLQVASSKNWWCSLLRLLRFGTPPLNHQYLAAISLALLAQPFQHLRMVAFPYFEHYQFALPRVAFVFLTKT